MSGNPSVDEFCEVWAQGVAWIRHGSRHLDTYLSAYTRPPSCGQDRFVQFWWAGSASRATTRPALLTPDISVHFVQCFDVLDPLEAGIKLKNPVVPSVSFALA